MLELDTRKVFRNTNKNIENKIKIMFIRLNFLFVVCKFVIK